MKAKFIGKTYGVDGNPVLEYEYRGRKYEVIDYGWKGGEPLGWQHKNEQAKIDQQIEMEEKKKSSSYVGEPAQVGLDLFFSLYK